jgi:hypothetical protein
MKIKQLILKDIIKKKINKTIYLTLQTQDKGHENKITKNKTNPKILYSSIANDSI